MAQIEQWNLLIAEHRKDTTNLNQKLKLAEVVGFLRSGNPLFAKDLVLEHKKKDMKNLKTIAFKDLKPGESYKDRVLEVVVADIPMQFEFETSDWQLKHHASVVLLVQDETDMHRAFIYNYILPSEAGNTENLEKIFSVGCTLKIADPQLKMGADGKLALVVSDPGNVIVTAPTTGNGSGKICRFCFSPNAESRCARCHKTYYCSKNCQTEDWKLRSHKLVCMTKEKIVQAAELQNNKYLSRPFWTVYQLETLCYEDVCPSLEEYSRQLRIDYGFAKCPVIQDEGKLIGLYQGMIKIQRVDMVKLHQAMKNNKLVDFVIQCFETYGSSYKGAYYAWFLENKDVLRRN